MTAVPSLAFGVHDWFGLFFHFFGLSLLSVGGAITTAPDMHRFLVDQQHWLSDAQFTASIAIAQAAPGPNVLFVALLGWNVGLNAGGIGLGLLGVFLAMAGILLPSTVLTYAAAQWGHRNRDLPVVRAFKQGLAPTVVALLIATGWILAGSNAEGGSGSGNGLVQWQAWLLAGVTTVVVWRTRLHLLWLLGAGALLGWYGLV